MAEPMPTTVTVTWHQRRQPQTWQCRNVTLKDPMLELDVDGRKIMIPLYRVRLIEITRPEPEPEDGDDD